MPENKNHNEDPIENLFRKKAEEYDISYREEDWLELEEQLDREDRRYAVRKKRWIIAAVVFFLFSLLGYAVYQNYQDINRINEQLSEQQAEETEQQEDHEEAAGERSASQRGSAETEAPTQEESQPSVAGRASSGAAAAEQADANPAAPGSGISYSSVPRITAGEFSCAACRRSDLESGQKKEAHSKLSRATSALPGAIAARKVSATPGFSGEPEQPGAPASASRAFIGLVAGPDLSTVGSLSDFDQPGYNLGLLFEYRLRSNFSIRGGLLRASVNYVADGSEYHPPGGFWSYGTVPDQTSAHCIILDIPLSVKYELWQLGRSRFYATAGFNSYIMLSEDYRFDYGYQNPDSDPVQQWSGQTGTRHWMSNAHLSVGYGFDLTPRISMQVEPFLKLPVREVGWGNVKLYSAGSVFSLNYSLY